LAPAGWPLAALDGQLAEAIFGSAGVPESEGLDLPGIVAAAAAGEVDALLVGGLEVSDLPDPIAASKALEAAKVVALQVRRDAISPWADVILPVAPPQEKAGTFINWEGKLKPFPQVLTSLALPDGKVLQALAGQLGFTQPIGDIATAHSRLARLGRPERRAEPPKVRPPFPAASADSDQAVLSTWRYLVDDASGLDGDERLAQCAPAPVARLSPATAQALGLRTGDSLDISTALGTISLPLVIDDLVDGVVHLPTKSPGSWVLAKLGATSGDLVSVAPGTRPSQAKRKEAQS
jgi:NADH-quinone oxidoreductase subunit G